MTNNEYNEHSTNKLNLALSTLVAARMKKILHRSPGRHTDITAASVLHIQPEPLHIASIFGQPQIITKIAPTHQFHVLIADIPLAAQMRKPCGIFGTL